MAKKDKDYVEQFEEGLSKQKQKAPAQFEQQTEKKVDKVKKILKEKEEAKKQKEKEESKSKKTEANFKYLSKKAKEILKNS